MTSVPPFRALNSEAESGQGGGGLKFPCPVTQTHETQEQQLTIALRGTRLTGGAGVVGERMGSQVSLWPREAGRS